MPYCLPTDSADEAKTFCQKLRTKAKKTTNTNANKQILKCRDDYQPVNFVNNDEGISDSQSFRLIGDLTCS